MSETNRTPDVPRSPAMTGKGVYMNEPAPDLRASIEDQIALLVSNGDLGDHGGIVAIPTSRGVNAAVVVRAGDHFKVGAWIGKTWQAKPWEYAAVVQVKF